MTRIKDAVRENVKLRVGTSSPSGFGKTYSALLMAYGIIKDWSKICVIDTESQSAKLYSHLGKFKVLELAAPFSPEEYIKAIKECESSEIELIIIDSISHEWEGKGGCLEIHANLGGQFNHWAKVKPRHNDFIQSILQSKCHVITTARRKQDYDMVKNEKGKTEPVKVGLKEVSSEGFEYELTVNFEIINDKHLAKSSKDRTELFDGVPEFKISVETGEKLIQWANNGVDVLTITLEKVAKCVNDEEILALWKLLTPYVKALEEVKNAIAAKRKTFVKVEVLEVAA
jgi:hypothetical protein